MTKPRLSFYTNIPTPYQLSFFKELAKLFELKVIYYASTESNRQWNFALNQEYEVVILKNNFIARFLQRWILDFHFSWQIFSLAFSEKSENVIVGAGYWNPNSAIALIANRLRSRKIAYFSEALFPAKSRLTYIMKWLCLRILPTCCKAILCIGKKAEKSFEYFKVYTPKFTLLYNIDPEPFQVLEEQKLTTYIENYKINGEMIILSSGSLIERKGMDILIKAFKAIESSNLRLLIIGEGPQKGYLQELAGKDTRIIFTGFQSPEEIPYFFGIADIFAIASRYDGWGVVINEAIAANVPVISSNQVGAGLELISSSALGILCESENVFAFRDAMESLFFSDAGRMEIKNNSRSLVPLISSKNSAEKVYDIFLHRLT